GFDPHCDTPVEILHVVLLGVVKYWWQDSGGRATLKSQLSSCDMANLGGSTPRGHTLVQYAGLLVGRDFRVVLQVAPMVLHGLVPDVVYNAWMVLCQLTPLVFQPEINNVPDFMATLKPAVENFLMAAVRWNTLWFNKPKFYLFVHIVDHILRFGPAPLYATKMFEPYNLVI
ncbi:uncharacterized protein BXZ73DRAFT_53666, partial [Epithele typhae]|uniref:uncharacterized protein n=1 Tax=Epithele typhae TaxID=378194 RepID=UPI0020088761